MEVPKGVKLLVAVGGIFASFSYFAVLQEDLFKKTYAGEKFKSTFFMMVAERGINAAVALVFIMIFGGSGLKIPINEIFVSGATQMFAMAASNEALRYVSYPTQVLGKSCKMVPVMLFGILIAGKAKDYSLIDYVQVIVVTIGVVVFNFGAPRKPGKGAGADSAYGLALIAGSLALDGATGGLQDRVKKRTKELNPVKPGAKDPKPTPFESMLYTNLSGAIVALVFCVVTGQLQEGIALCQKSPDFTKALLIFSLCSALGQCFIYYTVTEFTPLILSTVTTTRKIFSTVYSVFRYPGNSLNEMQWGGCFLVFGAIVGEMIIKQLGGGKKKAH
jgi:UDP-galactose transporter B1